MQRTVIVVLLFGMILFTACWDSDEALKARMESGKKVYLAYCQSCHMEDGSGVPRMNASLKGSAIVSGEKEKLIRTILLGSAFFANDTERYYQNKMPSQAFLTNEQIADILTYIRNSFTNKGSAIMIEDVSLIRDTGK